MKEIIVAGILALIAIFAFVLGIRSFCEKGILLNNAYLYASKQERELMDKKPYYRQSAIIFLLMGCIFAMNGCALFFRIEEIYYLSVVVIIGAIVYAIASSVVIDKQKERK